jgi:hypothetical protein
VLALPIVVLDVALRRNAVAWQGDEPRTSETSVWTESFVVFEWQRGSSAACKSSLWRLSVALIGFGFVASTQDARLRKCGWEANGAVQV